MKIKRQVESSNCLDYELSGLALHNACCFITAQSVASQRILTCLEIKISLQDLTLLS